MYEFLEETAGNVMTRPCKQVSPEATVEDLHLMFATDDVESYPVVLDGKVVGIVSKFDALRPFVLAQIISFRIMTRSWEPWSRRSCRAM